MFALPLCEVHLALLTALDDTRLARYDRDPSEVAFLGVGVSQIFAIHRGELGLFLINAIRTMVGAWLLVKPFESMGARRAPDSESVAEAESSREAASI